jgi:hypothetical protein
MPTIKTLERQQADLQEASGHPVRDTDVVQDMLNVIYNQQQTQISEMQRRIKKCDEGPILGDMQKVKTHQSHSQALTFPSGYRRTGKDTK